MKMPSVFVRGLGGLAVVLALAIPPETNSAPKGRRQDSVLILHDSSGPFGWVGGLHARLLANLLGHFDLPLQIMPVENYPAGAIGRSRAVFYLGSTYNNALPAAFKQEALATTKPVCWFKYNLWQISSGTPSLFEAKNGFRFDYLDQAGYGVVRYKGETFGKSQLDPELGRTTVLNSAVALAVAWACQEGSDNCLPYIVRGGNFWYVADTPFSFMGEEDRYVVFADVLHDILGIDHEENHRALIRLEDIDPTQSPEVLQVAADYLNSEGVPFLVSLIPVYTDPLGYYEHGTATTVALSEAAPFQQALRHLVDQGGQIVLHGYTHQYRDLPNPYTGVSGDDYEFFRVTLDAQGDVAEYHPVPEDSHKWAQSRVHAARRELKRAGFSAAAWETPHYAASATDSIVFGANFPLTIQRVLYFDGAGHLMGKPGHGPHKRGMFDSGSRLAGQFFPYVIEQDIYGQKIVPENLGNVDPTVNSSGTPTRLPADMIRIARKNKVVRDGWASGFFHPFLEPALLRELVQGIKAEGYTYVRLTRDMR